MKSVKNKLIILFTAIVLVSCFDEPGTDIVWGNDAYLELDRAGQPNPVVNSIFQRLNDGTTYTLNVQVNLMGKPRSTATVANFAIDAASTAIPGVHYNQITPGTSVTIPAGENVANIQFQIIADNIVAGEVWPLIINLTGGDVPLSNYVKATYRIQVSCPSNLAGTYSYVSTNVLRGTGSGSNAFPACNGITGNGTLAAVSNGVYTITDATFGQFACAWGDTPPGGTLRFNDLCDNISFSGTDKYGDSYTLTVVSVTASVLTIDWLNTYGDGGRAALTRTDGKTWPLTLN